MTERQRLIEEKRNLLAAKRSLMRLNGIRIIEVYEKNENQELNNMYSSYVSDVCKKDAVPYSRLSEKTPEPQIYSWIIDTMGLKEGREYFCYCGVWARIKIFSLQSAVQSLCNFGGGVIGFLLAETDLSRILELSSDSRDEYNYLIDIWKNGVWTDCRKL